MNIKSMPKEVAAELLRYIAEHEDFNSVEVIGADVRPAIAKGLVKEVAEELAREAAAEGKTTYDVKGCKNLSKLSKTVISCLSPREEKSLLSAFGLIDPNAQLSVNLSKRAGQGASTQGRK